MEKNIELFAKEGLLLKLINVAIYIAIGCIIYAIIKRFLNKSLSKNTKNRQKTITKLIINIVKAIIICFEIIVILKVFGIDVTSLLAGLGIASVVLGLALQDIMKDILAGLFIIIDDQFDVGDLIEINDFTGTVLSIGFKTTKIKDVEGKVKIISNRNIVEVTNYSKSNSFAILDVPVSYEEDLEKVEKVLNVITERINKEVKDISGEVNVLGIEKLADSSINYRIMGEVKPTTQYAVKREMRKIIKEEFDKANISIPYNKLEVINGK